MEIILIMTTLLILSFFLPYYAYRKHFIKYNEINSLSSNEVSFVIIGGASGLGKQIVSDLIYAFNVRSIIVIDIKQADLILNSSIIYLHCDISNSESINSILAKLKNSINSNYVIAIFCAAVAHPSVLNLSSLSFVSKEIENFKYIQSVNSTGIINFLYSMVSVIDKPTHIITISSCLGLSGVASWSAYCASKASLNSAHEAFRRDPIIAKRPINTTLFCLFFISDSPLFTKFNLMLYHTWLFTPLSIVAVSQVIIKECFRVYPKHQEIWMPWFVYVTPLLRLFPTIVYDYVFEVLKDNSLFY